MQTPPSPHNEAERLQNLRSYQVLDSVPEDAFDQITSFAATQFNVPIALVSLIDQNRQWFKSCIGLDVSETGRDVSFCGHAILETKPLIIENALLDKRFADNSLVTGAPFIRFYAGAPLISPEGYALGTLCLIDTKPRKLTPEQVVELEQLARSVMMRLKLRLANLTLQNLKGKLEASRINEKAD